MSGRVGSITTGIITDGLVFNMDAANRASTVPSSATSTAFNTIDTSISGAFVNGTIYDSSTISPSYGFDGTGDYIDINNESYFDYNEFLTSECWIYLNGTSRCSLIGKGPGQASAGGWMWDYGGFNSGQIEFVAIGGSSKYINIGTSLSVTAWHHVVATFNSTLSGNSKLQLYVDGEIVSSPTYTTSGVMGTILNNNYDVRIGARSDTGNLPLNGNIQSLRLYNRALSATEILHNYNALKGRFDL